MATLSLFDSKETNMIAMDSQQSRTDENKKSNNNHKVTNNIMTIAEAVAKETLVRANNMTKCAVELPSDGARLEPTLTLATTADHSQRTNTTKSRRANRSKKMLVVDPDSGKKYSLTRDDHSLTDKELHVYHKRQQKARVVEQSDYSDDELDELDEEDDDEDDDNLILLTFNFSVDPKLSILPQSFLNFFLRTAIHQIWGMFLDVATEVCDGKRPEHSAAIARKRVELYDWVEERTRCMLRCGR